MLFTRSMKPCCRTTVPPAVDTEGDAFVTALPSGHPNRRPQWSHWRWCVCRGVVPRLSVDTFPELTAARCWSSARWAPGLGPKDVEKTITWRIEKYVRPRLVSNTWKACRATTSVSFYV